MTKSLLALSLFVAFASPALAGDIEWLPDTLCTPNLLLKTVACVPSVSDGAIVVRSDKADFAELIVALTPKWDGSYKCDSQEKLDAGLCTKLGNVITTDRTKAGLMQLTLVLRSTVLEARISTAKAGVSVNKTIAIGGKPD